LLSNYKLDSLNAIISISKSEMVDMCKGKCPHPERLKGSPKDCTPEQIEKCHPKAKKHPCTGKAK
jgi:hypothetical protein